ncbi:hypothetical protein C2G38_2184908 [Gigaspora rosea]|uniref:Uncharacterized protein n=1 Tax=Gigaspora rosea TaxID=44941 RepID=A0A397V8B2_9GLOM|nr:hypothetical protein C2G38_2184908 [Gigaspora rosea]CAG8518961.1 4961_t:CDS:1 [Gigaspora rosea]
MSAIITKIVEKYNLSPKMSVSDLSKYISEFLENLTDDKKQNQGQRRLRDGFKFSSDQVSILIPNQRSGKNKTINLVEGNCRITITKPSKSLEEEMVREIATRILQNRYGFSEDQVNALFTIQTNVQYESISGKNLNIAIFNKPQKRMKEETIGEMAHWLLQNKLSIRDIRAEAYALALSAKNANAGSSRLSRLRRKLKSLGALPTIIDATKFPEITEKANEIQRDRCKFVEAFERIDYPDHFTLESVKERLDKYNISTPPDLQALADVMIMLCIRPAELTSLRITDAGVTGYAKNRDQPDIPMKFRSLEKNKERAKKLLTWIQHAISSRRISNPGKPGCKWFNRFLKDYDLIPRHLRKLGAVYGAVVHRAQNPAHVMTIARERLRHNANNHSSPVQNYVVVNYRKCGQTPEEARPFRLYDDNN